MNSVVSPDSCTMMRRLLLVLLLMALPVAGEPDCRSVRFAEGRAQGALWMLECRDMWDTGDDDGGVYFQLAKTTQEARREVRNILAHPNDLRLLGVYQLERDLAEQGAGLTAQQFLAAQGSTE